MNSQVGGLPRERAMSAMLGMTVLMPLPFPSTLAIRRGILYLKRVENMTMTQQKSLNIKLFSIKLRLLSKFAL